MILRTDNDSKHCLCYRHSTCIVAEMRNAQGMRKD